MFKTTYGGYQMPTVQLLMNGRIALPTKIMEALKLKRGSFLDVKLRGDEIVLTPQTLTDEKEIDENAARAIESIREKNKNIPLVEVERDVAEAVKAVRKSKEAKKQIAGILESVWERNKNLDPEEVQRIVDEARVEVRAKN